MWVEGGTRVHYGGFQLESGGSWGCWDGMGWVAAAIGCVQGQAHALVEAAGFMLTRLCTKTQTSGPPVSGGRCQQAVSLPRLLV